MLFYAALNAFRCAKNKNGKGSQFSKVNKHYKAALKAMKAAAELSSWNYKNKVHLLEAECHSYKESNESAKISYASAISSSRSSKLTHELALSCELAGYHHVKVGNASVALEMFQQAKEAYAEWGSQMKVDAVSQQISNLSS